MARTLTQALAQDERFQSALDKVLANYPKLNETAQMMYGDVYRFLQLRYQEHKSLQAIAAELHCSVRTIHKYYEHQGHRHLQSVLEHHFPSFARFVQHALNIPHSP
jgi:AraC-like DNA-binding protein